MGDSMWPPRLSQALDGTIPWDWWCVSRAWPLPAGEGAQVEEGAPGSMLLVLTVEGVGTEWLSLSTVSLRLLFPLQAWSR